MLPDLDSTSSGIVYDPLLLFLEVFTDPALIADLGVAYTCLEVNVLAGLLEYLDRREDAAAWLAQHRTECDDRSLH